MHEKSDTALHLLQAVESDAPIAVMERVLVKSRWSTSKKEVIVDGTIKSYSIIIFYTQQYYIIVIFFMLVLQLKKKNNDTCLIYYYYYYFVVHYSQFHDTNVFFTFISCCVSIPGHFLITTPMNS